MADRRRKRLLTPVWTTALIGVLTLSTGAFDVLDRNRARHANRGDDLTPTI